MSFKLILLCGTALKKVPFPPNPHEPYHVVFNPNVTYGDQDTYVKAPDRVGWGVGVKSLEPDSDHPPLPEDPYMYLMPVASITPTRFEFDHAVEHTGPRAVIFDADQFAHPDRRGRLPKAFEFRFGCYGDAEWPSTMVLKYCLNEDGSRYVGLRAYLNGGVVHMTLVGEFDGTGDWSSLPVTFPELGSIGFTTDTIAFIIDDGEISLYVGQPGVKRMSLEVPTLTLESPGRVEFLAPDTEDTSRDGGFHMYDMLIYDAYL